MTIEDTAQIDMRAVQTDQIPFALVSTGQGIPKLKSGILKTYASIIGFSFVADGQRISRATNREIAAHIGATPKTIGAGLVELERAGLVTIHQAGRVRTITIQADPEPGPVVWVKIRMDDPAWMIPDRAFKVYFGLKRFRGKNRVAWMTNQTLGAFLGMTESNVKRGFEAVKKLGLIVAKYEWHGVKRYRRVFFPAVNRVDMGEKVSIEDVNRVDMGEKVSIEDVNRQQAESGPANGQKSVSGDGKKVSHYGRKSVSTMGEKVSIEEEVLRRDLKEPAAKTKHTAHACTQGAEPETPAGVCDSGLNDSAEQESKAALDAILNQLQGLIKRQIPLKTEQFRIIQRIKTIWAKCGPIAAEFLSESLQSGIDQGTKHRTAIVIRNLNEWMSYDESHRAGFGDVITLCEDNQESEKSTRPLPGENGSGKPAEILLAERDGYIACTQAMCDRTNAYPEDLRQELFYKKAIRIIHGVAWINVDSANEIIGWYQAGYPLGESETLPVVKTREQELKALAFDRKNVRSKARKKWEKYLAYHKRRIEKMPIPQEDKVIERFQLSLKKDSKMQEFIHNLMDRYDREQRAIEAKYAAVEQKGNDHKRA